MTSKADRLALWQFLESLPDGRRFTDLAGPAVYELEPSWRTAVLCFSCRYIGLRTGLPRRNWSWSCPRCGRGVQLMPPLEVLAAKPPPVDGSRASRLS